MEADRTITAIDILFIPLLALFVIASAAGRTALWGVGAWGVVSVPLGVILAGCGAVIFIWRAAARGRLPTGPGRERPHALHVVTLVIIAFVAFSLLRIRHDLWGERHTIANAVEHGMLHRPGAALGTIINRLFYRLMNTTVLWNGTSSTALLSILAGAGFVAAAAAAARLLTGGEGNGGHRFTVILLIANGFTLVFFGAGGNAPVVTLLALLFLIAALRFVRGEIGLAWPALLFTASVFAHLPAVYLAPAFIYCVVRALRAPAARRRSVWVLVVLVVCWTDLEIAFTLLQRAPGPTRYLLSLVPGIADATSNLVHADAAHHLLAALNGFLILGPVSIAALALLVSRRAGARGGDDRMSEEERLLALCVVPAIILVIAAARRLDGGLRYDIFASAGPAFALYTLCVLRRQGGRGRAFHRAATLLIVLGVFHLIPLIVCNVHGGSAERRLLSLPLEPGRGEFILAERSFERREFRTAFEWYEAAVRRNPDNAAALARLGEIYMMREEYIDAVTSYLAAVEKDPGNREYRIDLAEAYIAKNWLEEAIGQLESLTADYPDSVRFWRRLGYARNHSNRYEKAIAAYERALELEPENEQNTRNLTSAVLNRAAELQKEERNDEARDLYERAKRMYPTDWRAYNNLAAMAMSEGKAEEALRILRDALHLHPYVSQLNLNMGLVLEELGDDERALRYLRKSAELDPLHSGAGPHIERLEKKQAERE